MKTLKKKKQKEDSQIKKFKDLDEKFGKKGTNYKKKNAPRTLYKEEKRRKSQKRKIKKKKIQKKKKKKILFYRKIFVN